MPTNNTIHVISFSPRRYNVPVLLQRNFLLAENGFTIVTENGLKLILG